jgi:hypothetical protein
MCRGNGLLSTTSQGLFWPASSSEVTLLSFLPHAVYGEDLQPHDLQPQNYSRCMKTEETWPRHGKKRLPIRMACFGEVNKNETKSHPAKRRRLAVSPFCAVEGTGDSLGQNDCSDLIRISQLDPTSTGDWAFLILPEKSSSQELLFRLVYEACKFLLEAGTLFAQTRTLLSQGECPRSGKLESGAHKSGQRDFTTILRGCVHYQRNCMLKAECCGKWVSCRLCHNETSDHGDMDRHATEEVMCLECHTEQSISNKCVNEVCGTVFGMYYCRICKFFDNSGKEVFHCEKCGICRAGAREDSVHCEKCNSCVRTKHAAAHKCHTDALRGNCPCCLECLHSSVRSVLFMTCGHAMHTDCFETYTRTMYSCPLCKKSLCDTSNYFNEIEKRLSLRNEQRGDETRRVKVRCNDCGEESNIAYNPWKIYKCGAGGDCQSFNTRSIMIYEH